MIPGNNIQNDADRLEGESPLSSNQPSNEEFPVSLQVLDFSEESELKESLRQALLAEYALHQSSENRDDGSPHRIIDVSGHIAGAELLSDDDLEFVNAAGVMESEVGTACALENPLVRKRLSDSLKNPLAPDNNEEDDMH